MESVVLGARNYLLKDDPSTIEAARNTIIRFFHVILFIKLFNLEDYLQETYYFMDPVDFSRRSITFTGDSRNLPPLNSQERSI